MPSVLQQGLSRAASVWHESQRLLQPTPDLAVNTSQHVACLSKIFDNPRRSTQRFVEQLTFLPEGGQRWTRSLQIQIPPKSLPEGRAWRVVSLGPFRRRRLPDLVVRDATGSQVNLLTRHDHGAILLGVITTKHFTGFTGELAQLQKEPTSFACETYHRLLGALYERFTTVGDLPDLEESVNQLTSMYECLLGFLEPSSGEMPERVGAFRANVKNMCENTRYLCWVLAAPGEIIHLNASYTTADARQRPEWRMGSETGIPSSSGRIHEALFSSYRELGLAPLKYRFLGRSHANSYYFTLEPPPRTEVTHLDWSTGNNFEDGRTELDSALDCVHFHYPHNSSPGLSEASREIWVHLRSMTHGHKQIAIGAALNIMFVFLIARGSFSGVVSGSVQTWLLVTPTVLTAYIADQQRHYYAYATRRQRGILWLYLVISVNFLVAISFHLADESATGSDRWSQYTAISADGLLVSSVLVCVWYALLGYSFRAVTQYLTKRPLEKRADFQRLMRRFGLPHEIGENLPSSSEIYDTAVYRYCSVIFGVIVALLIGMCLVLTQWWTFPPTDEALQSGSATHVVRSTGAVTLTTWPSRYCPAQGCNFDLRFVPSQTK